MRRYLPWLFSLSLVLVLGVVFLLGAWVVSLVQRYPSSVKVVNQPVSVAQESHLKQHNVLFILADDLSSPKPRLRGVWFVISLGEPPRLTFLPLFPAALKDSSTQDVYLNGLFQLNAEGAPDEAFLAFIEEKGIRWDNYILLDYVALAQMVEMLGGVEGSNEFADVNQLMISSSAPGEQPYLSLLNQAKIALGICYQLPMAHVEGDLKSFLKLQGQHFVTDFPQKDILMKWNDWQSKKGSLSCEFPTIKELSQSSFDSLESGSE